MAEDRVDESSAATASGVTLETLLSQVCCDPATRSRAYSKAELLGMFARSVPGNPEEAFARVRSSAKSSTLLGSIKVAVYGERRGTKYTFAQAEAGEQVPPVGPTTKPSLAEPVQPPNAMRAFAPAVRPPQAGSIEIYHGDNLPIISGFAASSFDLIYIDPPFNTGRVQSRTRIRTEQDEGGDRVGYQGRRYRTTVIGQSSYSDRFDDYIRFLAPRLEQAHRLLTSTGSLFLHLDYREVHYAKVLLDEIFGRESFINEIIWSYDYGARATNRWSAKHDNILWYAKDPHNYCFNYDEIDRIPYMAPSLVGEEKAARGKTPTDSWWNTIVSPNGKEKTGYPTQKPLGILIRIVRVHSREGDRLLDFFAGSGSFGEAGAQFGRHVILVDESPEAIEVMRRRFLNFDASLRTGHTSANGTNDIAHSRGAAPPDTAQPSAPARVQLPMEQRSLF